jgi:hypothetical protein
VNPSNSPFFQTTYSDLGIDTSKKTEWNGNVDPAMLKTSKSDQEKFTFLYTRESDRIGARVPKSTLPVRRPLTKTEFLKQRRENLLLTYGPSHEEEEESNRRMQQPTPEETLRNWRQGSKPEDPRYTTSSNEYGKKAPTIATFVAERQAISQTFSNSFSNVKPKNTSLNTGITRSNVHPSLDPLFA